MLELAPIRDQVIGPIGHGLSSEQRKRVTIGVEVRDAGSRQTLLQF